MLALLLGTSGLLACESQEQGALDQAGAAEESVTVALSEVPASTLCIRVTALPVTGWAKVKSFIVSPGASSANLQMGALWPGDYGMSADAFPVACGSISGAGDWIADPVTLTVRAGAATTVNLTFRKNAGLAGAVPGPFSCQAFSIRRLRRQADYFSSPSANTMAS